MKMKNVSVHTEPMSHLYIHIPFCIRKCRYCDFLSGPQDEETRERYVRALIREIRLQGACAAADMRSPGTVFLGGGTPSMLMPGQIDRILQAVFSSFSVEDNAEISMELNPGTADLNKMRSLRAAGINRLSIGVQSQHDEELRLLGRIHDSLQAKNTFHNARKAGFDNINIDLMSALPGQTFESWADTLARTCEWKPEHISAYSLILEPGTVFAAMQEAGHLPAVPDEETDRRMYHYTRDYLAQNGYARYEISNYALPGRECIHNCGYWTGRPYLGMGIGAASCTDGRRFSNISDLSEYLRLWESYGKRDDPDPSRMDDIHNVDSSIVERQNSDSQVLSLLRTDVQQLTEQDRMEEFMFLGLRMTEGVRAEDFEKRFGGKQMEEVFGDVIRKHISQGVVERTDFGIRLTERGTDVSNYVMADYLL